MMKKIELKQQTLIDKIELRNGQIISIRDVADLIHRDIAYRSNDRMMYETDYGDEFSYLRVVNDKWIHQLKAGITGFGNPYTNLQMGIYDEDTGNLRCNTVAGKQIVKAFEQAEKEVTDLQERTREGLVTAKLNGKQIGNEKGTKLITKKSIKAKEEIKAKSKDFGGTYTDKDLIKVLGLSRNTFYKYKKELIEELNK